MRCRTKDAELLLSTAVGRGNARAHRPVEAAVHAAYGRGGDGPRVHGVVEVREMLAYLGHVSDWITCHRDAGSRYQRFLSGVDDAVAGQRAQSVPIYGVAAPHV